MELHDLPDLSDWQKVEVWTIDEAALLWSAIDPDSLVDTHIDFNKALLGQLFGTVDPVQERKAKIYRRAIIEAVCAGTLSFVSSIEIHDDFQNGPWEKEIDFPDLPKHNKIVTHMTRINQAAFMKWANGKNIPSFRKFLGQQKPIQEIINISLQENYKNNSDKILALPAPMYLDPKHPRYTVKLNAAVRAWENNAIPRPGRTVKQTGADWITENAADLGLIGKDGKPIAAAISEASTVANWEIKGGPAKTPG